MTDPTPKKFDTDKPRYDLLPPKALGLLVACLTYGSKKYDDYNWRKDGGIDPNRLFAATQRHLWAWKEGEVMDKESGLPHLAHAATNLLMMLDLACRPPVKIPNFSPKPQTTHSAAFKWLEALGPLSLEFELLSEGKPISVCKADEPTRKAIKQLQYHKLLSENQDVRVGTHESEYMVNITLVGWEVLRALKSHVMTEEPAPVATTAVAPELRPIQGWPYQEIEKAMKHVGGSKKAEASDGPMVVYPLEESTIKSTYAQLHAHRHDPKHFWAYDIVSDPEDVRYFSTDDGAAVELERLGVFTKVSAFTNAEGKERWTYSRTALGHAVKEYIHKIDAKVEPEPEATSKLIFGAESEAYYWISRCSPESRAYKIVDRPEDVIVIDNTNDNQKLAASLMAMFDVTPTEDNSTITLYRTPSGHKIRSLLNAKS